MRAIKSTHRSLMLCVLSALLVVEGSAEPLNVRQAVGGERSERVHAADTAAAADPDAKVKWSAINQDLDDVAAAIDGISQTLVTSNLQDCADSIGAVTNTVFTEPQRTAIKNLKSAIMSVKQAGSEQKQNTQDVKTALKNLQQAMQKLEKKLKATEDIKQANGVK